MAIIGFRGVIYDFARGEVVRVRTTNGGDIVGSLYDHYRRTYDICLSVNGRYVHIPATRILEVTKV